MPIYSLLKELSETLENLNALQPSLAAPGIPYIPSFEWWDIDHTKRKYDRRILPPLSSEKPGKVYLSKKELKLVRKLRKETIKLMKEKGLVYESLNFDNTSSTKKSRIVLIFDIESNLKKELSKLKRAAAEKYLFGCICTIYSSDRQLIALFEGRSSSVEKIKMFSQRKLNLRFCSINSIRNITFKRLYHKTFDNLDFAAQYFRNLGEIAILNVISERIE